MRTLVILTAFALSNFLTFSQVQTWDKSKHYFLASSYNKEESERLAKKFFMQEMTQLTEKPKGFVIDALATSSSGHVTTLYYESIEDNTSGLIIGFYGNYITEEGTPYLGYAFYHFDYAKAIEFLDKIIVVFDESPMYQDGEYLNYGFTFDELDVLCCILGSSYTVRIFWNGFDAEWEASNVKKTRKRLTKKKR